MGIELTPQDELFHDGGGEAGFSEWVDLNFYDISVRLGGFLRLHQHPAQGFTEMTIGVFLPDGRIAFMYERSGTWSDSQLGAGGLRLEVIRPFDELNASYDGKLLLVEDPCALLNPEQAYSENPQIDATLRLTFSSLSTLYEARGDPLPLSAGSVAGHYEQLGSAIGSVRTGDDHFDLDGSALRGHRWGARASDASSYRRRFTANVGPSFGFMGSALATMGGARLTEGFVWDGTVFHRCDGLAVTTMWTGADTVHHGVNLTLKAGDQRWHARGTVMSLVVRRDDGGEDEGNRSARRISEAMTEWRLDDGQVGYGMSEYFDRIVDGQPMGLCE